MFKKIFCITILLAAILTFAGCDGTTSTWPTEKVNEYMQFEFPAYNGKAEFSIIEMDNYSQLKKTFRIGIDFTNFEQHSDYVDKLLADGFVEDEEKYNMYYFEDGDGSYIIKRYFEKEYDDGGYVKIRLDYDYSSYWISSYIEVEYDVANGAYSKWSEMDFSMFNEVEIPTYDGGKSFNYSNSTEETRKQIKNLLNFAFVGRIFMGRELSEEDKKILSQMQGTRKYIDRVEVLTYSVFGTNLEELEAFTSKFSDWEVLEENGLYAKNIGDMTVIVSIWCPSLDNLRNIQISIEKYPNEYYEYFYNDGEI